MKQNQLNWITNFIWNIADDVLRDVYVRGKYRDVILPMTVIRRLDAVLEHTKLDVLEMKKTLDDAGITNQDAVLRQSSGQAFYNTSPFTLRDLKGRAKLQQLKADFEDYLDGFSPNVQEILNKFKFRNQIPTLIEADVLGYLIEKFLDSSVNLSPNHLYDQNGNIKIPGLDNHAMGTIFEELIRRFNEENNEEAGEHFTPRDVVQLMAKLIFLPVTNQIESGTYLLYDGACGTGGMLTVAEETLQQFAKEHSKDVSIHLYGQEINAETYAISKADLLLKGEGEEAENFGHGSTLSQDAFLSKEFDFMLSNPPYGKSWKTDLERMGGKSNFKDPRFIVEHAGDPEFNLVTRSSDGQMMFLVNMLQKMKHTSKLGSRIAEVHNASSLFTGDAGQGESNIRRWIIENDWLEAIIALPLNMFYNTGIATYIWVLTNRKPEHRKGKVQLIDATDWYKPLRKNLGKKNCELTEEHIGGIYEKFLTFEETKQSKILPNEAFGYWKVNVERPLRLRVELFESNLNAFREVCKDSNEDALAELIDHLVERIGPGPHLDFNTFLVAVEAIFNQHGIKLTAKRKKFLQANLAEKDENGIPVISRVHKQNKIEPDPLNGRFEVEINGLPAIVEYEPDTELRESEQISFLEKGGVEEFFQREVLPYATDAWIDKSSTKIGYEISFTRYFYKQQPLRSLEEIKDEIFNLEAENDGLLKQIMGGK
ncbi:type I restriction-modification system subunit M [Priestia megaterium]|uniref:type I restriction-modification system subunit M n=1 Tax=Priestia megaterium TaxID=1404 RepID=UPI001ADF3EAC|nr:class I SAM-dependent DNA methyltransferase [Priestia megaterium]